MTESLGPSPIFYVRNRTTLSAREEREIQQLDPSMSKAASDLLKAGRCLAMRLGHRSRHLADTLDLQQIIVEANSNFVYHFPDPDLLQSCRYTSAEELVKFSIEHGFDRKIYNLTRFAYIDGIVHENRYNQYWSWKQCEFRRMFNTPPPTKTPSSTGDDIETRYHKLRKHLPTLNRDVLVAQQKYDELKDKFLPLLRTMPHEAAAIQSGSYPKDIIRCSKLRVLKTVAEECELLKEIGVDEQVATEWGRLRNAKRCENNLL